MAKANPTRNQRPIAKWPESLYSFLLSQAVVDPGSETTAKLNAEVRLKLDALASIEVDLANQSGSER